MSYKHCDIPIVSLKSSLARLKQLFCEEVF